MENITTLISHHNLHTTPTPSVFSPYLFILFLPLFLHSFPKFFNLGQKISTNRLQLPLPPGPKPWPLVGCLPALLVKKPVFQWIHNLMEEQGTGIACMCLGNVHVVTVTCPDIACQFLKKQNLVCASRPLTMTRRIVSNGYLSTSLAPYGQQWKKMKRILVNEMLSPARHRFFQGKRIEEADYLVRCLYNQCVTKSNNGRGLEINLRFVTQHYCGNLVRKMMFNRRSLGNKCEGSGLASFEDEEHIGAVFSILENVHAIDVFDYLPCFMRFKLDGHVKLVKEATDIMSKYHDPIIEQRINEWSINGNKREVEDLLDIFVTLKDGNGDPLLSKHEIQAQIIDIIVAAVDNPSNAVEWALAEMLNQPEILAKAVEELDRVVGKERLVEESDFSQLNYLKACIKEAFRLHPVAAFNLPHVSMKNMQIGNYFIPKGSLILLSRMGLGRNPKVWHEPEKFKPERHLNGNDQVTLNESNLRLISFSTGSRGCPGLALGTSMTLMLFARLLQGFSWHIPSHKTSIDLRECKDGFALANPLLASPIARLPTHVYFA